MHPSLLPSSHRFVPSYSYSRCCSFMSALACVMRPMQDVCPSPTRDIDGARATTLQCAMHTSVLGLCMVVGLTQLPWLTMHLSTHGPLAYRPSMTVVQRRMAGNLKKWVLKNLLPVSLVCAVALGAAWPTPGVAVGSKVDGNSPAEIACVGNAHLPRLQSTCLLCTHPLQTSRNGFVIRLFCTHVAFHHCCVTSCARFTTDN